MMDKKDAIEYLLYMKHDVQAGSPVDVAIDMAIEALKQPIIEPEVLMIKSDAARSLTDEEAAIFEEWLNHDAVIEPEVRHGEWHECWHTDTVCASICTNCGKAATQARVIVGQELMTNVRYPLCPHCGAHMDLRTPT